MKNRLEALRKARGIKQEELAEALEVSRQTIGSLENGRYNPSILLAFKLAPALAAGNSVIFKPSSNCVLSTVKMFEIFEKAGMPKARST